MIVTALIVICVISLYFYGTRNYSYWKERGVTYVTPLPLFGTEFSRFTMRKSMAQAPADVYWKYPNERFVGGFRASSPTLVIRDPDLVKHILVTDFKHFYARGFTPAHKWMEPLLRNLFFADGDLWRLLRQRMTPAFTSGKLKAMFPLIVERAERLQVSALAAAATGRTLDARDLMARYTIDFIGSVGFGLDADSLSDEDSAFRKFTTKIVNPTPKRALVAVCKNIFPQMLKYQKFLGQELEDDIMSFTRQIREHRGYKPTDRNDFIDYMLECQQKGKISVESLEKLNAGGTPEVVHLELDDILVAAQALVFFVAGFETSSSGTSFALHQLAFHPDIQETAQVEIDRVLEKHNGKLSYDAVKEMTYLEWVFMEGMRIFPPSGFLMRECVKKYTIPDTDVTIDVGVKVTVPIQAIQMDPKYFDKPTEFRPERFSPKEVAKRHKFVYLPFGDGPRGCIGARLGLMQSLAGLAAILAKFKVSPAPETRRELISDPRALIVQNVIGGIPLNFTERTIEGERKVA